MFYDVVIVGGGLAGLTSCAYLAKQGYKVILCEQGEKVGGLVNTFDYNGFKFDGGIRAIENSGIIFPMLKQLGINIPFTNNVVSLIVGNESIKITSRESLSDYEDFLGRLFPENRKDIQAIIEDIKKIMAYMKVLYGIDNPLFLDYKEDAAYLTKTALPWLFKFLFTIRKIEKLDRPVYDYLKTFTSNEALIDIIAQHFFQGMPAYFALFYFSLYLDYQYPLGGTGVLPQHLESFILEKKRKIRTNCEVVKLNQLENTLFDGAGNKVSYKKLIWAANSKTLYKLVGKTKIENPKQQKAIAEKQRLVLNKKGCESVLTINLTLKIEASLLKERFIEHIFYTPNNKGLSNKAFLKLRESLIVGGAYTDNKELIFKWLEAYLSLTTYEISCPAMRDKTLAPEGQLGLIVSTLFEYDIVKHLQEIELYNYFKEFVEMEIPKVLFQGLLKGLDDKVIDVF